MANETLLVQQKSTFTTTAPNHYNLIAQAGSAVAVTKSDSTVLAPCALYVGTGGNLVVDTINGETDITFANVPDGTFLPMVVTKVKAATTASNIVALR